MCLLEKYVMSESGEDLSHSKNSLNVELFSAQFQTPEKILVIFMKVQLCHKTSTMKFPCLLLFMMIAVNVLKLYSLCYPASNFTNITSILQITSTKGIQATLDIFL